MDFSYEKSILDKYRSLTVSEQINLMTSYKQCQLTLRNTIMHTEELYDSLVALGIYDILGNSQESHRVLRNLRNTKDMLDLYFEKNKGEEKECR